MNSQSALEYGIVDEILTGAKAKEKAKEKEKGK
jgi:ATP-dependent protease ClpP protease subunit